MSTESADATKYDDWLKDDSEVAAPRCARVPHPG
jgi:hypothetical protein